MIQRRAFTLIELLTVVAVVAILAGLVTASVGAVRKHARETQSAANIRQLAAAANLYAADHGRFAPWGDVSNTVRWHGRRERGEFTGRNGFLSPYLDGGAVRYCPEFERILEASSGKGFDLGAGGYGYNSTYIGGNPRALDRKPSLGASRGGQVPHWAEGNLVANVLNPTKTVMFTSTAIVRGSGIVETDQSAPPRSLVAGGLGESMTPTTHFRFDGKALVAWADGHVTLEPPNQGINTGHNVYGGNNDQHGVGWFGPEAWNGYWNPRFEDEVPY